MILNRDPHSLIHRPKAFSDSFFHDYLPSLVNKRVDRMISQLSAVGSLVKTKIVGGFQSLPTAKTTVGLAGKVCQLAGHAAYQGAISFDELLDVADFSGTKNPLTRIKKSYQRLSEHDKPLAEGIKCLAEQAAKSYIENAEGISHAVGETVSDLLHPYFGQYDVMIGMAAMGVMHLSDDLIAQTLQANILHIAANLADQGFDPHHPFADQERNPFGRLLSVIGRALKEFPDRLNSVESLPDQEKSEAYKGLFQEMSVRLLATLFPKGAKDLQLFHHTLPCVNWIKEKVWEKMHQELPVWLERSYQVYQETLPLSKTSPKWEDEFNAEAYSLEANQLFRLPSALFQAFVRSDGARLVDEQQPVVEDGLKNHHASAPRHISHLLIKYGREFLLTNDPCLQMMGAYVERYVMERLLFNLSRFVPVDVHIPLPLYVLQQWIEGEPLKMVWSALLAAPQGLDKEKAIRGLLAPFGLERQETFPLPSFFKERLWPTIERFQRETLPDLLFEAIPAWVALTKMKSNQHRINDVLNDDSLTKSIHHLAKMLMDQKVDTLADTHTLIGKTLQTLIPSLVLSDSQQQAIQEQFNALINEGNPSLAILKERGEQGLEALAVQLCVDLLNHFIQTADHADQPFALWFFSAAVKACDSLVIKTANNQERQALIKAIHLKQAIHNATDPLDTARLRAEAELDTLWPLIKGKFHHLAEHLINLFGYSREEDLPFPKRFRSKLWERLFDHLPFILFKQTGDLLLPLLEKQALQIELDGLPQGERIQKGCRLLAQDIVHHLPKWFNGIFKPVLEKWVAGQSHIQLTEEAQEWVSDTLSAIVNVEDPVYDVLWKCAESYLEALFLKIALNLSQISPHTLPSIQTLAQQTRQALLALETDVLEAEAMTQQQKDILNGFIEKLLTELGIESNQSLFGIPQQLQKPLLKEIKERIAQVLLGIYQVDHRIRDHVVTPSPLEGSAPVSEVARAVLALTRYALDKGTKTLTHTKLYLHLIVWLDKQRQEGYEIAELFQEIFANEIPTPWLVGLFDLLHGSHVDPYKAKLADWINPLLTDQVLQYITPLLEKEQEGGATFDQAFIMALLPLLIDHLKQINQASQMSGGLTRDHILKAAGLNVHPAVAVKGSKVERTLQQQKLFYDAQARLIFQLIFPHGKEDLVKMLPEVEFSDDQFDDLSTFFQQLMLSELPKACQALLDKKILVQIFSTLFTHVIHTLDQPIKIPLPNAKLPSLEEKNEDQERMDQLLGELIVEAARFIELPVDFFQKFPIWMKQMMGLNAIEKSLYQSIGEVIREKFNGQFLAKTFQEALPTLAEYDTKKAQREGIDSSSEESLKALERELAEKSFAFIFRTLAARFERATDVFNNSVLKFLRRAMMAVAYVLATCVGKLFRVLRMERFVIHRLDQMIRYRREKVINVLSQQELHENVFYRSVEAIEDLLISGLDADGHA